MSGAWMSWDPHAVSKSLSSQQVPNLDFGCFPRCKARITKDPEHITCTSSAGSAGQYKAMGFGATCAAGGAEEDLQGEAEGQPCPEPRQGGDTRTCIPCDESLPLYRSLVPRAQDQMNAVCGPCGDLLCPFHLLANPSRRRGPAVTAPPGSEGGGAGEESAGRTPPPRRGLRVPPRAPGATEGSRCRRLPAPSARGQPAPPGGGGRARGGAAPPLAAERRPPGDRRTARSVPAGPAPPRLYNGHPHGRGGEPAAAAAPAPPHRPGEPPPVAAEGR